MKVYLDDLRETPAGWTRTYTVEQTIELLKTKRVEALSLDNDLGEGLQEGWKVLDWLEQQIHEDPTFPLPDLAVHSANSARVRHMYKAIDSIHKIRERQKNERTAKSILAGKEAINNWQSK